MVLILSQRILNLSPGSAKLVPVGKMENFILSFNINFFKERMMKLSSTVVVRIIYKCKSEAQFMAHKCLINP